MIMRLIGTLAIALALQIASAPIPAAEAGEVLTRQIEIRRSVLEQMRDLCGSLETTDKIICYHEVLKANRESLELRGEGWLWPKSLILAETLQAYLGAIIERRAEQRMSPVEAVSAIDTAWRRYDSEMKKLDAIKAQETAQLEAELQMIRRKSATLGQERVALREAQKKRTMEAIEEFLVGLGARISEPQKRPSMPTPETRVYTFGRPQLGWQNRFSIVCTTTTAITHCE